MIRLILDATDNLSGKYTVENDNPTDRENFALAAAIEKARGMIRSAPVVKRVFVIEINSSKLEFHRKGDEVLGDEKEITRQRLELVLDSFIRENLSR